VFFILLVLFFTNLSFFTRLVKNNEQNKKHDQNKSKIIKLRQHALQSYTVGKKNSMTDSGQQSQSLHTKSSLPSTTFCPQWAEYLLRAVLVAISCLSSWRTSCSCSQHIWATRCCTGSTWYVSPSQSTQSLSLLAGLTVPSNYIHNIQCALATIHITITITARICIVTSTALDGGSSQVEI